MNYSLKSLLSLFSIIICFHAVEIREKWAEGREKGRSKESYRERERISFLLLFSTFFATTLISTVHLRNGTLQRDRDR